jgi:putative PIN family toxin of toxin-antitoxin system
VFDSNVLVSILIRLGKPRELWNAVLDGRIGLILSEEMLAEFNDVIVRSQFRRYLRRPRTVKFQRNLVEMAEIRKVRVSFPNVTEDPDDSIILEAAYSGKADYIVSGDRHLLKLGEFKGIKIVNVDEMFRILKRKG